MIEKLKEIYKKIDNDKDMELKVEQKSESYTPKTAYYRYIKFCCGGQGFCDTREPLSDWKPLSEYSDKEMNEWNMKFPRESWYELKIETKIK